MRGHAKRPPGYRKHKQSGQAVVTLNGKDFYLGPYGTNASKREYTTVCLVDGWQLVESCQLARPKKYITVTELFAAYRTSIRLTGLKIRRKSRHRFIGKTHLPSLQQEDRYLSFCQRVREGRQPELDGWNSVFSVRYLMRITDMDLKLFSDASRLCSSGEKSSLSQLLKLHPELVRFDNGLGTLLMVAAYENQPGIAKLLVEHGADVNHFCEGDNSSPIHAAVMGEIRRWLSSWYLKVPKCRTNRGSPSTQ